MNKINEEFALIKVVSGNTTKLNIFKRSTNKQDLHDHMESMDIPSNSIHEFIIIPIYTISEN